MEEIIESVKSGFSTLAEAGLMLAIGAVSTYTLGEAISYTIAVPTVLGLTVLAYWVGQE